MDSPWRCKISFRVLDASCCASGASAFNCLRILLSVRFVAVLCLAAAMKCASARACVEKDRNISMLPATPFLLSSDFLALFSASDVKNISVTISWVLRIDARSAASLVLFSSESNAPRNLLRASIVPPNRPWRSDSFCLE